MSIGNQRELSLDAFGPYQRQAGVVESLTGRTYVLCRFCGRVVVARSPRTLTAHTHWPDPVDLSRPACWGSGHPHPVVEGAVYESPTDHGQIYLVQREKA